MLLGAGIILLPGYSHAYHNFSYYYVSNSDNMCTHCHPGGPHNHIPACTECHTASAPPYSVDVAPEKQTHSYLITSGGSDHYGQWVQECLDCHEPHHSSGIVHNEVTDSSYKLAEFTGLCQQNVNKETTMGISNLIINDPAWSDPATWSGKTGDERGLVVVLSNENGEVTTWFKVISATSTSITFKNEQYYFPPGGQATPQNMFIAYGQFIKDTVNGTNVVFTGPSSMANDESGTGIDPTPNGICQVCHTQTAHWRNDGTRADHFSGYRCTICHPHDQGFRYVDPGTLCPADDKETVTVLEQWNIDIQGDSGSTLYGQEGIAHPHGPDDNGVWNVMNLPPLDGNPATVVTNPSLALVNNGNTPTTVVFSVIGSVGGWSGLPGQHTLIGDYLIMLANHYFGYPDSVGINFSGLDPGATYELTVRSGEDGTRNIQTVIDLDGDGSLEDETPVTTLGGGKTSSFRCVAGSDGVIAGRTGTATTNEANLAGLILKKIEVTH